MKATELRIGNLAYRTYKSTGKRELIQITSSCIMDISANGERSSFIYEPIPLTEEWHNKFGVKRNGFQYFEYILPRKNNLSIKVIFTDDYVMLRQSSSEICIEDDIISVWNKDLTKRDMFVNEWQNLYFAITGEELTLKE